MLEMLHIIFFWENVFKEKTMKEYTKRTKAA